jgi:REP element-mobilizing transposase RayT
VDLVVLGKEIVMREWQSLSHVKWYCRYHVVFVPKYRKKVLLGSLRRGIGKILRDHFVRSSAEPTTLTSCC